MKSALGIVLIVFGLLAGASAASMSMNAEAQKLPPAERFGQALGGALCSLTLLAGGAFLALTGGKKPKTQVRRRRDLSRDDSNESDGSPTDRSV